MADNETYDKLLGLLVASDQELVRSVDSGFPDLEVFAHPGTAQNNILRRHVDAIWPEIVELLAKIGEYEHALEHVAGPHTDNDYCASCTVLAHSALDGVNRADFREMVNDDPEHG